MNVRVAAAKTLASLMQQQGSLASLLPEAQSKVSPQEQSFLQELCYGGARWWPRLHCIAQKLLDKPLRNKDMDIYALILLGLYQLIYLRTPDHAAIGETVEAAKRLKKQWAAGLINGTLRRFQREGTSIESALATNEEFVFAHPQWLIEKFRRAWPEKAGVILDANNQHPPFTLRVNQRKISRADYLQKLRDLNIEARACVLSPDGINLQRPVAVEQLLGFQEGWLSVQDEAPQLCAGLLELRPGLRVLDACCAPGGKTAHIAETEANLDQLLGIDISAARIQRTQTTLSRLGLNAELRVGDAARPLEWLQGNTELRVFDRILVDAPCSATGIIRRQPDIKILRQPAQVELLVQTQLSILQALWPLLKPGGLLLYATCSILPEENSQLIERFLAGTHDGVHEPIEASWGEPQAFGRQLLPDVEGADGFFYGKLRRT